MPKRDDPRWSARATIEEDEVLDRIAGAMGVRKGTALRACVRACENLPVAQLSAAAASLRPAAAELSSRTPERAGADSSPAPASARLVQVVAGLVGNPSLARRSIALGEVRVGGKVSRNFDQLVDPSDVEL